MNPKADWIAWTLHYICGLSVGAILGLFLIYGGFPRRLHRPVWLSEDLHLPWLVGAALIGAPLASLLGDKLWVGNSYKMIPPDGLKHSPTSKRTSSITLALGTILLSFALIAHTHPFFLTQRLSRPPLPASPPRSTV